MPDSNASYAAAESAQYDFSHSLLELCRHRQTVGVFTSAGAGDRRCSKQRSAADRMQAALAERSGLDRDEPRINDSAVTVASRSTHVAMEGMAAFPSTQSVE
jgi:hypothetical protein